MNDVPTWLVLWAIASLGIGILYLLLRSVFKHSTIYRRSGGLPPGSGPTAVEQDFMDRFPESRFL
jgi:hypothetical protein